MSANYNLLTNAYKDGYKQGFKAGQASRTPIKWPTEKDVYAASAKACKNDSLRQYYFEKGVEWLKSFVEKDKSE